MVFFLFVDAAFSRTGKLNVFPLPSNSTAMEKIFLCDLCVLKRPKGAGEINLVSHPSTMQCTYPSTIFRSYGTGGAGRAHRATDSTVLGSLMKKRPAGIQCRIYRLLAFKIDIPTIASPSYLMITPLMMPCKSSNF